jgi:hypothetical protein
MWKLRNSVALLRPGEARFPLHSYEATRFAYSSILHVSGQISERACNLLLPAVLLDLGGIKTSSTKKKSPGVFLLLLLVRLNFVDSSS